MVEPNPRWSAGFFGSVLHSPARSYARTIASVLIFRTSGVVTADCTIGRMSGPAVMGERRHGHRGDDQPRPPRGQHGDQDQDQGDRGQLRAEDGAAE